MKILAAILALTLMGPSIAQANRPPAKWEPIAKAIAMVPFRPYYCPNFMVYYRSYKDDAILAEAAALGARHPLDCWVQFNTDVRWNWTMYCHTMVHEVGHLAGLKHKNDANSVMYYAYVARPYRLCRGKFPGPSK